MTTNEIYADLTDIFHEIFDDQQIELRPDTTAADIADWDSFNHINIIVAAETRFGIKFQTSEVESLKNVGDMATTIERKLSAGRMVNA